MLINPCNLGAAFRGLDFYCLVKKKRKKKKQASNTYPVLTGSEIERSLAKFHFAAVLICFQWTALTSGDNYFISFFFFYSQPHPSLLLLSSLQLPSLTTLWSAAEGSDWPSLWPKTASTGTATARPPASWRWTSLNCWGTVNTKWAKRVSNTGKKMWVNWRGEERRWCGRESVGQKMHTSRVGVK